MRLLVVALLFASLLGLSSATTYYLYPTNTTWASTIQNLKAGDTAILSAGQFTLNQKFGLTLSGTAGARIVVKGAGASQTTITQNANQNVMDVAGTYFSFYNMTFTGGSRGVRLFDTSSDVLFENVNIHHTQDTAFSANDAGKTYTRLTLRGMEVHHSAEAGPTVATGECYYLGCQDNKCQVISSLVELNYCHDTTNAKPNWGSGIQLKTGSYDNIIRDNVIVNTLAPGILLYDDYQKGTNVVEGNVVMNTLSDNGIQVSSGVRVQNNIVINAHAAGIAVSTNQLQTAGVYHDVKIIHNTVYASGSADLYLPILSKSEFVIANNLFLTSAKAFDVKTQTGAVWRKNAYVSGTVPTGVDATGVFQVTSADVINAGGNDFYPTESSLLIGAGSANYSPRLTYDFNGKSRSATAPTVGAYEHSTATNPGGAVKAGFKSGASSNSQPPSGGGSNPSSANTLTSWLAPVLAL